MRINGAIKELWKERFFEAHRNPGDVKSRLNQKYGMNPSNITMNLKSCKSFIRKENAGWIQKTSFDLQEGENKKINLFDIFKIHNSVRSVSENLFNNKHYAQAILEAYKKINNIVKRKSGLDIDGKALMMHVFNESDPILKFNNLNNTTERNIQEGTKFLMAGAMIAIRNPKAHDEVEQKDPILTIKYIAFASLLAEFLDYARKN